VEVPETSRVSFDSLIRISRREAHALTAAGRLCEALEMLRPSIEAVLERYVGRSVRMRVVVPRAPADMRPMDGPVGFDGVVARVRCLDPPSTFHLMVPAGLCGALASSLLGAEVVRPYVDPALHEAVITHLVADVLRCLPSSLPLLRLDAVTLASGNEVVPDVGRAAVLFVRLRLAGLTDLVTVVMPERSLLEGAGDALAHVLDPPASALDLRYEASVVCATATVGSSALAALEEGDVLLPDTVVPGAGPDGLRDGARCDLALPAPAGHRFVASVTIRGDEVRVGATGPLAMEGIMHRDDERTVVDEQSTGQTEGHRTRDGAVEDMPAQLVVEAGRASLSVREILALSPGTVIPLKRPVSAEVTLAAGGRTLAHGVLVDVEGELGVQVLKVLR
jgi:flagellar motor switch/type III secretory pathway protein FliN